MLWNNLFCLSNYLRLIHLKTWKQCYRIVTISLWYLYFQCFKWAFFFLKSFLLEFMSKHQFIWPKCKYSNIKVFYINNISLFHCMNTLQIFWLFGYILLFKKIVCLFLYKSWDAVLWLFISNFHKEGLLIRFKNLIIIDANTNHPFCSFE